jgi:hypothetical protein
MTDFAAQLETTLSAMEPGRADPVRTWLQARRGDLAAAPDKAVIEAIVRQDRSAGTLDPRSADIVADALAGWTPSRSGIRPPPGGYGRPVAGQHWIIQLFDRFGSGIALTLMGLVIILIIGFAIFNDTFLGRMTDIGSARGLITFVFTIGTMGIAVFILIALFTGDPNDPASQARFNSSKEILTTLIAILATVVGFYFGSATREDGNGGTAGFAVGTPVVLPPNPTAGSSAQLNAFVAGARLPLTYSIDLRSDEPTVDAALQDVADKTSTSPLIQEILQIPSEPATQSIVVSLLVKDAAGRSISAPEIRLAIGTP